jgi:glycosyltransferase involved in cell wall biosynthesis
VPVEVVPPPLWLHDTPANEGGDVRDGIILHVGRFAAGAGGRQQARLIDAFAELVADGDPGWALHLAGAVGPLAADRDYYLHCRARAAGLPVHFHPNARRATLEDLYRRASCYWHPSGFAGGDAPADWLGFSLIEAMAAGCIGFAGGSRAPGAITADGVDGFLAEGARPLIAGTRRVLAAPAAPWVVALRQRARQRALAFASERFTSAVRVLAAARQGGRTRA